MKALQHQNTHQSMKQSLLDIYHLFCNGLSPLCKGSLSKETPPCAHDKHLSPTYRHRNNGLTKRIIPTCSPLTGSLTWFFRKFPPTDRLVGCFNPLLAMLGTWVWGVMTQPLSCTGMDKERLFSGLRQFFYFLPIPSPFKHTLGALCF